MENPGSVTLRNVLGRILTRLLVGSLPALAEFSAACTREVEAPSRARDWIEDHFAGLVELLVMQSLQLIASELITNAVDHGAGDIELCVAVHDRQARLEVTDEAVDCDVVIIPLDVDGVRGRGLRLVEAYSQRWGCKLVDNNTKKMVWAEIDLAP